MFFFRVCLQALPVLLQSGRLGSDTKLATHRHIDTQTQVSHCYVREYVDHSHEEVTKIREWGMEVAGTRGGLGTRMARTCGGAPP